MIQPKTIKIYLLEGAPTGVRTVELSGWTGKGFVIPRSNLAVALERPELKAPSVYFLIGENDEGQPVVYVGESENFVERIRYHHRDGAKDFWNTAICFISKDETLNKAYVKYLESVLFADARQAHRAVVEGGKDSLPARLSESDQADADEFAEHIRLLLPSMGYTFLQEPAAEADPELWYCKGKDASAKGKLTSEGFVVLKGSLIRNAETRTIQHHLSRSRATIFGASVISTEKSLKLPFDVSFGSPSTAAGFVLGRSANGWIEWKNAEGRTMDEVKRQQS